MLDDWKITAMLPTANPEAAKRFYSDVLGLELTAEDQFALIYSAGGTPLRLQKVGSYTPHPFTALGWAVRDVHAAAKSLAARGVRFERFDGLAQDEDGVWVPPGSTGGVCWFKDPDGNLLSLSNAG